MLRGHMEVTFSAGVLALGVWLLMRSNERLRASQRSDPCIACHDHVRYTGHGFVHVSTGLREGPDDPPLLDRDLATGEYVPLTHPAIPQGDTHWMTI
jgi:hypothetical protein